MLPDAGTLPEILLDLQCRTRTSTTWSPCVRAGPPRAADGAGGGGGEEPEPADTEPVRFVFGDPDLPPAGLPRRTSVERAVGDHLRAGGHWYVEHGWLRL